MKINKIYIYIINMSKKGGSLNNTTNTRFDSPSVGISNMGNTIFLTVIILAILVGALFFAYKYLNSYKIVGIKTIKNKINIVLHIHQKH